MENVVNHLIFNISQILNIIRNVNQIFKDFKITSK